MGKRKADDRAVAGPSTKKRKNHKDRALWIDKYKDVPRETIVAAGFEVSANGLPMMKCVGCDEVKERTTDFFTADKVLGDLEKWFSRLFPRLNNFASYPCNSCWAQKSLLRIKDIKGDGWLLNNLVQYPNVKLEWAKSQFEIPEGEEKCWATGCTLPFQKGSNAFALSVNSIKIQVDKKYSRNNDHEKEDITFVYRWANCRQTVQGQNQTKVVIIPSLRLAYTAMFEMVKESFDIGPLEIKKLGDEMARKMRAYADFGAMVRIAKQDDKKRGFDIKHNLTVKKFLKAVKKQNAICSTSGIVMTSFSACGKRGPFDVHMDRIEDATNSANPKGHVAENVEFKCRLFSNACTITRKDFLLVFLNQLLVPLPDHVRALAQAEYDAMPCNARDAWKHAV
jgi:hypothetical protein